MSMNKIAKGAGIAQPSFYNHFDSVEALQQELGAQLKDNYLSPMRMAWVQMLRDYTSLNKEQFTQRCQHCLNLIFDAAFQNIALFQRLLEDSLRFDAKMENGSPLDKGSSNNVSLNQGSENNGLGYLITEIKEEWTQIFIQGLETSECSFERTEVNLCIDIAAAQVHELILGCQQQRYSRQQAIAILSKNFDVLFMSFFAKAC